MAFHIFTTSPNYQLFRACHDEKNAFDLCLIYYDVCALAIPTIGSHMNLNRLRSQLMKEVPCMEKNCLKIPTHLSQAIVPVNEKRSNRGVGADDVELLWETRKSHLFDQAVVIHEQATAGQSRIDIPNRTHPWGGKSSRRWKAPSGILSMKNKCLPHALYSQRFRGELPAPLHQAGTQPPRINGCTMVFY